jgi:formylmethanofuran dehydrogenase subunit E
VDPTIEKVRAFHGHLCPGVTIGVRVAQIALREIGPHSADSEVLAVVETAMCPVDAIQLLTGCTLGNGNLIYQDHGKSAFTFIRPAEGKAIRIVTRPSGWPPDSAERQELYRLIQAGTTTETQRRRYWELMEQRALAVLEVPEDQLFDVRVVAPEPPERNRVMKQTSCDACGEPVMISRVRQHQGRTLCIPCFELAQASGEAISH